MQIAIPRQRNEFGFLSDTERGSWLLSSFQPKEAMSTTPLIPDETAPDSPTSPDFGDQPVSSTADETLAADNSASTLIESPVQPGQEGAAALKRHEFPDGGGSGGAEAFRRRD